jgi:hypothetical protein
MNARAWFATQSFHHEETPRPNFRTDDCRSVPAAAPLETYDTPWGPRPLAQCEHEVNRDGADVMLAHDADPDCPRHLCEFCCDDTCCRACHAVSVVEDAEYCAACQVDQEMARRADEDLAAQSPRLDDRTAADRFYDRWKAAREDGR